MTALNTIVILLFAVREPQPCFTGLTRSTNRVSVDLSNGTRLYISQYEVCVNGTFLPVCRQNIGERAELALCTSYGNFGDSEKHSELSLYTHCMVILLYRYSQLFLYRFSVRGCTCQHLSRVDRHQLPTISY